MIILVLLCCQAQLSEQCKSLTGLCAAAMLGDTAAAVRRGLSDMQQPLQNQSNQ
jgi:hypothetical protein